MEDWKKVADNFIKTVGFSPLKLIPTETGAKAYVMVNKVVFAILDLSEDKKVVDISFRASILPNSAAFIATIVGNVYQININQNFDYGLDGERLIGKDAIEFSARAGRIAWQTVDHIDSSSALPARETDTNLN